jgi:hypothetical protein
MFHRLHLLSMIFLVALSGVALSGIGQLAGAAQPAGKAAPAKELLGLPLVFFDDFESGADRWEQSVPRAWKLIEQNGNHVYNQFESIDPMAPFRSPYNRALVKELIVKDFVLDVKLQSTKPDYPHRDMCLFFGYQDPTHLFYVHFGKKGDDVANQVMIVNNGPRKKISIETTPGTDWNDDWHHARIVRKVEPGTIEVYFDDMTKPVMKAVDKTFTWGQVGIGSFDDTGNYDDVAVYGRKVERPKKAGP